MLRIIDMHVAKKPAASGGFGDASTGILLLAKIVLLRYSKLDSKSSADDNG